MPNYPGRIGSTQPRGIPNVTTAGNIYGGEGGGVSAFETFKPTGLADAKQSFTFNPSGSIDGDPVRKSVGPAVPVQTGGQPISKRRYYVGKALFDAVKALIIHPAPRTGTVPSVYGAPTLGGHASLLGEIPYEATEGSVNNFYAQDGQGSMINAPINNNALTGIYVKS